MFLLMQPQQSQNNHKSFRFPFPKQLCCCCQEAPGSRNFHFHGKCFSLCSLVQAGTAGSALTLLSGRFCASFSCKTNLGQGKKIPKLIPAVFGKAKIQPSSGLSISKLSILSLEDQTSKHQNSEKESQNPPLGILGITLAGFRL